jgi:hypothetical protein
MSVSAFADPVGQRRLKPYLGFSFGLHALAELQLLIQQLRLYLPPRPPPKITAAALAHAI